MLIYPTAIGWDPRDEEDEKKRQQDAWITIQRSHAVANGIPLISVNRVGHEEDSSGISDGIQFWGNSFSCGPQGELLGKSTSDQEANLVVKVDMSRSENVRRIWPFLRDRRIENYSDITCRFLDK